MGYWVAGSAYVTGQTIVLNQPVTFSHEHHVGGLGLDCRYCHSGVEKSPVAGVPPTQTCMTCHSELFTQAEMLAPVRRSLAENQPIRWNKVYKLPDYVYFDHSIHIAKGCRLHHLSWAGRSNAADAKSDAAYHGLVPRLSSQSSTEPAPYFCNFRSQLEPTEESIRRGTQAARSISYCYLAFDRLLGVPPMIRSPDNSDCERTSERRQPQSRGGRSRLKEIPAILRVSAQSTSLRKRCCCRCTIRTAQASFARAMQSPTGIVSLQRYGHNSPKSATAPAPGCVLSRTASRPRR
jgi:hypothetical protein